MKKKITFKMWLSVFFGGIWQFIRNIFSWKNKTPSMLYSKILVEI